MERSPKQEEREQSEHQFEFQISHPMKIPLHEWPESLTSGFGIHWLSIALEED
jgi:hypothetical protein